MDETEDFIVIRPWMILNNFQRMREGWKPLPAVRACILRGATALGIGLPEGVA